MAKRKSHPHKSSSFGKDPHGKGGFDSRKAADHKGQPRAGDKDRATRAGASDEAGKQGKRRTFHSAADRRDSSSSSRNAVLLYGRHAVLAALANPRRRPFRLILASAQESSLLPAVEKALAEGGHRIEAEVQERTVLDRLTGEEAIHQGILLEAAPLKAMALEDLLMSERPVGERRILLALDQVTDPQNAGAILRSAAAFGACGMIVTERHGAGESGALARAASGALDIVARYSATNLARALEQAKDAGWWVAGLAEEGPVALGDWTPPEDLVLVLGAEGPGLRRLTRATCDILLRLPTDPALPSLNVSNAAAVALFALARKS